MPGLTAWSPGWRVGWPLRHPVGPRPLLSGPGCGAGSACLRAMGAAILARHRGGVHPRRRRAQPRRAGLPAVERRSPRRSLTGRRNLHSPRSQSTILVLAVAGRSLHAPRRPDVCLKTQEQAGAFIESLTPGRDGRSSTWDIPFGSPVIARPWSTPAASGGPNRVRWITTEKPVPLFLASICREGTRPCRPQTKWMQG